MALQPRARPSKFSEESLITRQIPQFAIEQRQQPRRGPNATYGGIPDTAAARATQH
jgi:hypothetical protein